MLIFLISRRRLQTQVAVGGVIEDLLLSPMWRIFDLGRRRCRNGPFLAVRLGESQRDVSSDWVSGFCKMAL